MKLLPVLFVAGLTVAMPAPQRGQTNGACNAELTAKLTGGIQSNLDIQAQELKGVQVLQSLVKANTTRTAIKGASDFEIERQAVLTIQQKGIDIRAQNEKIASDINSAAQKGIGIVAQAQNTEMMQIKGLQGGGEQDQKTLEMLVKEVEDGTKQNQMNLQMAESQCKKR